MSERIAAFVTERYQNKTDFIKANKWSDKNRLFWQMKTTSFKPHAPWKPAQMTRLTMSTSQSGGKPFRQTGKYTSTFVEIRDRSVFFSTSNQQLLNTKSPTDSQEELKRENRPENYDGQLRRTNLLASQWTTVTATTIQNPQTPWKTDNQPQPRISTH